MEHKELIKKFLDKGIILSKDILDHLIDKDIDTNQDITYLNKDILSLMEKGNLEINWHDFEKAKSLSEKTGDSKPYHTFLNYFEDQKPKTNTLFTVTTNYTELSHKWEVQHFTKYFNSRLEALQKILYARDELKNTTSINRVIQKRERENVSIIGIVKEFRTTKNNNIMLTLEDATGEIKVLVNKNKPDMWTASKDIVLDEVIGISGVNGDNIVFANNVIWPDIPLTNELKKSNEEGYALFLSDIHVGSNNFLEDDFKRFLSWINQKAGSDSQKEIASKVKYIFIVGDLVDGVGIFPEQDKELDIEDIYKQYEKCAELLLQIPKNIQIFICAGNHDSLRLAEPQPPLPEDFCKPLFEMENVTMVSNPSVINIHSSDSFKGYDVLLYHGYSFDYYVANVDSIRNNGGYDKPELIMKFLLKRRHLAPTHTSTLYIPYPDQDPLVIQTPPDIFATGHIHKSRIANYKNITLICGSCWQSTTPFQIKVGHHPEPSRVPIINLKNRQAKILRFGK